MNARTITHIEGAEIDAVIRYILEQHGCTIHDAADVITFPRGTMEEELIPRMPFTERTTLTLPDGTVIYKIYNRIPLKPITTLCVTKEVYEDAQQLKNEYRKALL